MAIPAIGQITDPKKTRVALVQGQQIVSAPATALSDAVGVPSGGTTGQVLTKSSGTDYDSGWADIPAQGDLSGPASAVDGNFAAFDGTTGKLVKDSGKKPADFATAAQGAKADTAVQPSNVRELLTANRTYYVATTGSDSNDGLTSGTAFLTVQKAVNVALAIDMSIYAVTISVGAGTFAEGSFLNVTGNGNARITIVGAGYASTTISGSTYAVNVVGVARITLQDVDLLGSSICVSAATGASITFAGTCQLSGGSARLVQADVGGAISALSGTIRVNVNSGYVFYAQKGGVIVLAGSLTVATANAITVTATVTAQAGGILQCTASQVTWNTTAGAITGSRYSAALNGVINTVTGGGANYFPGSTAGSVATGGQYA